MKILLKKRTSTKTKARLKNKARIRRKIEGTSERPRLCVFRSASNIYAQLVDDIDCKTIASASSLKLDTKGKSGKEVATLVGTEIAKAAQTKSIKEVVFDRNGFIFHGRVKAVADAARENGLEF